MLWKTWRRDSSPPLDSDKLDCLYLTHWLINQWVNLKMPDTLSQTFAALADPTRRAMLARLSKGEANVSDLAKPFLKDMSLPAITKHLKVLEKARLITKTRRCPMASLQAQCRCIERRGGLDGTISGVLGRKF